jgi:hypothetical protein
MAEAVTRGAKTNVHRTASDCSRRDLDGGVSVAAVE